MESFPLIIAIGGVPLRHTRRFLLGNRENINLEHAVICNKIYEILNMDGRFKVALSLGTKAGEKSLLEGGQKNLLLFAAKIPSPNSFKMPRVWE